MMFRQKPIIVEAEQYWPGSKIAGLEFNWDNNPLTPDAVTIETSEGRINVSPGDWIIKRIKGELYLCKPDIFAATYEVVQ